jgi:hypothetical protein
MEKINLIKKVRGINTYKSVIDTEFKELITKAIPEQDTQISVSDFFNYYDLLFYDIPVTGDESHTTLVQRSQQYIGGEVIDLEKQALIEEINGLRQQIIDLSQTYLSISDITK